MASERELAAARIDARKQVQATWKNFLESTPPNTSLQIPGLVDKFTDHYKHESWRVSLPQLELHCETDGGVRRFQCEQEHLTVRAITSFEFVTFTCRDCGSRWKTFALMFHREAEGAPDVEVMKLGEYPPFSAPVSKRVAKLLGKDDLELYRKGTRAEVQSLGIGAASYFRRIVDNQWKLLVTEIREAAQALGEKDLTLYDRALAETQFSTAVDMLKDAIPGKLLILDSQNPLTLLYKPLSVQLHNLSDGECLQQAADIRKVLTALLENIADVLKDQQELKDAADRLRQSRF